jgi:hypothetical protein
LKDPVLQLSIAPFTRAVCSIWLPPKTAAFVRSMAFLAPNLVQAAVEGRLPRGVGIANLRMRRPNGRCNMRGSGLRHRRSPQSHHGARNRIFSARDRMPGITPDDAMILAHCRNHAPDGIFGKDNTRAIQCAQALYGLILSRTVSLRRRCASGQLLRPL